MNKIILATGCDFSYRKKPVFQRYIDSINLNSKANLNIVFSLDFNENPTEKIIFEKVHKNRIVTLNSNNCLQHGAFLEGSDFSFNDEDILIFTDGDIILQRWFSDEEIEKICRIDSTTFLANYNMSQGNTAEISINHLGCTKNSIESLKNIINVKLSDIPDYNTGVLIARISAWKKVLNEYNKFGYEALSHIPGFWGQQFILNASITKVCNHEQLPYSIHTHSHHLGQTGFGPPINPEIIDGKLYYNKELVMFAHRFFM